MCDSSRIAVHVLAAPMRSGEADTGSVSRRWLSIARRPFAAHGWASIVSSVVLRGSPKGIGLRSCCLRALAPIAVFSVASISTAGDLVPFTEESVQRGIDYMPSNMGQAANGFGVAFVDLDGDGDDDFVSMGAESGIVGVWENQDGYFIDRSAGSGIPPLPLPSALVAADYDADGRPDLFIGNVGGPDMLLKNMGSFTFVDRTNQAGVAGPSTATTQGSAFGDVNGDGWLDLYVSSFSSFNSLYRNNGDGTFSEISQLYGVYENSDHNTFQTIFFDYDRDGWLDIYTCNDKGYGWPDGLHHGNRLWRNTGDDWFIDVTFDVGVGAAIDCMGVDAGDINNDGLPDLYMSNASLPSDPNGNPLYVKNPDDSFTQMNVEAGLYSGLWGWGVLYWDFDNNGWQDIYVCNANITNGPNLLFRNPGSFPLENVTTAANMADWSDAYTVAYSDVDDDGDLDLAVSARNAPLRLYINNEGTKRNWVKVRLIGKGNNTQAIGASLDLVSAGQPQYRQLLTGRGFKSSSTTTLHFGLGPQDAVDALTVSWPGDPATTISDIPANQAVVLDQQSCTSSPTWSWSGGPASFDPPDGATDVHAQTVLTWDSVPGATYEVHFGATDPPPLVLETDGTAYIPPTLDESATYYWRVKTTACVVSEGEVLSFATSSSDTGEPPPDDGSEDNTPPFIVVTSHPTGTVNQSPSNLVIVSGSAFDDVAVESVQWTSVDAAGSCSGTENWTCADIPLAEGQNEIAVVAQDAAGNEGSATILFEYVEGYEPDFESPPQFVPSSGSLLMTSRTFMVLRSIEDAIPFAVWTTCTQPLEYSVEVDDPRVSIAPAGGTTSSVLDRVQHLVAFDASHQPPSEPIATTLRVVFGDGDPLLHIGVMMDFADGALPPTEPAPSADDVEEPGESDIFDKEQHEADALDDQDDDAPANAIVMEPRGPGLCGVAGVLLLALAPVLGVWRGTSRRSR